METPDPFMTTEQLAALVATVLTNVVLLLKLDVSDAQQASILALVNTAYVVVLMIHAAVVRNGRARSLTPTPRETP